MLIAESDKGGLAPKKLEGAMGGGVSVPDLDLLAGVLALAPAAGAFLSCRFFARFFGRASGALVLLLLLLLLLLLEEF